MRPKDALLKDGFPGIKAGKGRLSKSAVDRLHELVAQGWEIDGYSKVTTGPADAPTVKAVANKVTTGVVDIHYTFPENAFRVFETDTKRDRSMRDVCMTCRVSLVAHICEEPMIVACNGRGFTRVTVVPLKVKS